MKTISNSFSRISLALALLFILFASKAEAQTSPYPITNNTACNVSINWRVVRPNCNTLCGSGTIVVTTGTTNSFAWGCMGLTPCDIKLEVTQIGTNVLSPPVGVSLLTGSNTIPSSGCGGPYTISMSGTGALIN